jgi:hypothetical protein
MKQQKILYFVNKQKFNLNLENQLKITFNFQKSRQTTQRFTTERLLTVENELFSFAQ